MCELMINFMLYTLYIIIIIVLYYTSKLDLKHVKHFKITNKTGYAHASTSPHYLQSARRQGDANGGVGLGYGESVAPRARTNKKQKRA